MTELEQQLLKALEKLSTQYETEQSQQRQIIETLTKQVNQLSLQVNQLSEALSKLE